MQFLTLSLSTDRACGACASPRPSPHARSTRPHKNSKRARHVCVYGTEANTAALLLHTHAPFSTHTRTFFIRATRQRAFRTQLPWIQCVPGGCDLSASESHDHVPTFSISYRHSYFGIVRHSRRLLHVGIIPGGPYLQCEPYRHDLYQELLST